MKEIKLEQVMAYQNEDIVARFVKNYGVDKEQANIIFDDVKRWLWLAYKVRAEGIKKPLVIDAQLVVLDEMWHNFILFTREYSHFCKELFGQYLHHSPNTESNKKKEADKYKEMSVAERKKILMDSKRWQYEFIYDHLGKDVFIRWYKQYPGQYTVESLCQMAYEAERQRSENKRNEFERISGEMSGAA